MIKKIKTRLAPSPTGFLHIGTARTALFNYLFAKQNNGKFILRIEDTDQKRSKSKYEQDIKKNLKWLGLDWDEEYKQSNRSDIYKKYLEKLIKQDKAYFKDSVIWFRAGDSKIKFKDLIRGSLEFDMALIEDFVIAKSLDGALYNFACVIDDFKMGITHVIRGEDHISNTPRQILIYKALNLQIPQFAHLPLMLNKDRSKLSKRHCDTALKDYKQDYLPDALINYMALLGWNPGTPEEIFTKQELIKKFDLKRVHKGGAIFDIDRLNWVNSQYIKSLSNQELSEITGLEQRIVVLEKDRVKKLSDFKKLTKFINKLPDYNKSLLFFRSLTAKQVEKSLKKAIAGEELKSLENWPPRVAVSGLKCSPPYHDIKPVLGEKETLKRLNLALEKLEKE